MATRITTSVKTGGVEGNAQLSTIIEKAKKANVAKKIIDNAIKRGTGELAQEGAQTSEVMYEFMGPAGVAFIVEANTDNKNRTIGLVKHALSKFNASLSPCQYMFQRKGEVIFQPISADELLDSVLEVAIDVGAEDVEDYVDVDNEYSGQKLFRIITDPADLNSVSNNLSQLGYMLKDSKVMYLPDTEVEFPEDHEKGMNKCLDLLDDISEVTNYYTNIKDF